MLTIVLQAAPASIQGWVGPTIAISLAIVAFACVVMFVAMGLAALALRRALVSASEQLGQLQALVGRVRDEGDAYLATSRRFRTRLDHGIERVSERATNTSRFSHSTISMSAWLRAVSSATPSSSSAAKRA